MFLDETGDVGTERDDPEAVGAREIERKAGKSCRYPMAFERLRHFGVHKKDAVGKAAVGEQGASAIDEQFETLRRFVVDNGQFVEIHVHVSPGGLADCAVRVGLFRLAHEDLRVTWKVYQGIRKN